MSEIPKKTSCNRHDDCEAAIQKKKMKRLGIERWQIHPNFHCHDDECEDCFGC